MIVEKDDEALTCDYSNPPGVAVVDVELCSRTDGRQPCYNRKMEERRVRESAFGYEGHSQAIVYKGTVNVLQRTKTWEKRNSGPVHRITDILISVENNAVRRTQRIFKSGQHPCDCHT